jgi:hypothetical protein
VRDFLTRHYANNFDAVFGKGTGKAVLHATAGRCPPKNPSRIHHSIPLPSFSCPLPAPVLLTSVTLHPDP